MCGFEPLSLTLRKSHAPIEAWSMTESSGGLWFDTLLSTDPTLLAPLAIGLTHILNVHVTSIMIMNT